MTASEGSTRDSLKPILACVISTANKLQRYRRVRKWILHSLRENFLEKCETLISIVQLAVEGEDGADDSHE